jgi:hypothetical protein
MGNNLEVRVGNKRVSGYTTGEYCFNTQKNYGLELDDSQKKSIVEKRVKKLNDTEWQRWTPGLGFFRVIKDTVNSDSDLLLEMYPISYTVANIAYNVSVMIVGTSLILGNLLK